MDRLFMFKKSKSNISFSKSLLQILMFSAKFLEFFTEKHPSWAHLDIAGVAFGDSEFAKTKHATAYGVHLITKFIENL